MTGWALGIGTEDCKFSGEEVVSHVKLRSGCDSGVLPLKTKMWQHTTSKIMVCLDDIDTCELWKTVMGDGWRRDLSVLTS